MSRLSRALRSHLLQLLEWRVPFRENKESYGGVNKRQETLISQLPIIFYSLHCCRILREHNREARLNPDPAIDLYLGIHHRAMRSSALPVLSSTLVYLY